MNLSNQVLYIDIGSLYIDIGSLYIDIGSLYIDIGSLYIDIGSLVWPHSTCSISAARLIASCTTRIAMTRPVGQSSTRYMEDS